MSDLIPEHLSKETKEFLENILSRCNFPLEDIKKGEVRVIIHPDMIPDGLSQDVSDQYWLYISENVYSGYVVCMPKKDIWTYQGD